MCIDLVYYYPYQPNTATDCNAIPVAQAPQQFSDSTGGAFLAETCASPAAAAGGALSLQLDCLGDARRQASDALSIVEFKIDFLRNPSRLPPRWLRLAPSFAGP